MTNSSWDKITKDFLWFTLENETFGTTLKSESTGENRIELRDFSATYLTNGLLFLLPEKCDHSKILILSAGIHGNETAPMELLQQWTADIFSGKLTLALPVLIIIGNPAAAKKTSRFIDENLNRLFSLDSINSDASLEQRRAVEIVTILTHLKQQYCWNNIIHFDLHTAIRPSKEEKFLVLPFKEKNNHNQNLLSFWSHCGLTAALRSDRPAKTFSYFTQSEFDAISATVELGKVAPFGENNLTTLRCVDEGIRLFITTGEWPFTDAQNKLKMFQVKKELIKTSDQFELFIDPDFANFSGFENGYLLAQDRTENFEFKIRSDREVLIFPNIQIPVGQRAGLVAELE